ncbi:MAG: hypothetical protein D6751_08500 [Deltaproteobacteria bacterium]|nr:MAG: hypothetical protein D6751_08500 [Deltaproteobacteria bacterium]
MDGFRRNPGAAWLTGGMNLVDQNGRQRRYLPPYRYSFRRLVRCNIIFHPATFVRLDTFRRLGMFDRGLKFAMDYDLWLRLAEQTAPVVLDRPLASFRVHAGSRSMTRADLAFAEEFLVRKRFLQRHHRAHWPHSLAYGVRKLFNRRAVRSMLAMNGD